jgi:transcription initiation factor TFIIIB Brf1 subunit/transcription initiation factor TFIIB
MNILKEEDLLITTNEMNLSSYTSSATAKKKVSKKEKTKKRKQEITEQDKHRMWEAFRTDRSPPKSTVIETEMDGNIGADDCVFQDKNYDEDYCFSCNSLLMVMDEGFPTCVNPQCGIIYRNTLDYSPEWRYFGVDDKNANDPTRCGNPINPLLTESSFGCKVLCTPKSSFEMKKIRKWTEWQSMPHKEKSLYDVFQYITIMAQNSGIPKIFIDEAIVIYKDISEQKIFRGLNRDGIKAASIYISCRLNGCPRTSHEISEIFKLDKTSATNGCSMAMNILNNLERKEEPTNTQTSDLCTTTPVMFIERYCSKLSIPSELVVLAKFVANKLEKNSLITDNTPNSIAAGVIYFISQNCNLNISKMDIKLVCGVSEVTINKCFKKMETMKEQLIPSCILDKYV